MTTADEVIASMNTEGRRTTCVWVNGFQGVEVNILLTPRLRASESHQRNSEVLTVLSTCVKKVRLQLLTTNEEMRISFFRSM